MTESSSSSQQSISVTLKQAANWQCQSCGRLCRHGNERLEDFASRIGQDISVIRTHPRRWTLYITRLYAPTQPFVGMVQPDLDSVVTVLCGSCHRTYHNHRRWQQQRQQYRQQQEHIGQLTLRDIRLPLSGLQLSLDRWGTPYEIVNPLTRRKRR